MKHTDFNIIDNEYFEYYVMFEFEMHVGFQLKYKTFMDTRSKFNTTCPLFTIYFTIYNNVESIQLMS